MSGDAGVKAEWVRRALGVSLPGARDTGSHPDGAALLSRVRGIWQEASDTVNEQMAGLQAVLRQSGDDDLEEIADYGLHRLIGECTAPLETALSGAAAPDPASAPKALIPLVKAINDSAATIAHSLAIEVCDDNPFGAPVSIRRTLGAAFESMRKVLAEGVGKS